MALMKWNKNQSANPFEEFDRLQALMGQVFSLFNLPEASLLFDRSSVPAVDVSETQDEYIFYSDLPGVDIKDIDFSIVSNVLTIKGEKSSREKADKPRKIEIAAG